MVRPPLRPVLCSLFTKQHHKSASNIAQRPDLDIGDDRSLHTIDIVVQSMITPPLGNHGPQKVYGISPSLH